MIRLPLLRKGAALILAALATGTATAQLTTGFAQGPNGNFYEAVYYTTETMTWDKAMARAELRPRPGDAGMGHLATITDEQEDVFIESLRQQALTLAQADPHDPNAAHPLWIGGRQTSNQSTVDTGWQWLNGDGPITPGPTGMGYTNWLPGEPNDWPGTGVEDNQENYLAIGLRGTFSWNDSSGLLPGFVVEYETTEAPVTIGPLRLGDERGTGNDYEIVIETRQRSWEEAAIAARCRTHRGRAGHLATINTKEEDYFIETLRQQAVLAAGFDPADPNSHPSLWLGARQESDQPGADRGWNWINGEGSVAGTVGGSGYQNWLGGEPNDWPSAAEDNQENYLAIGLRGLFAWNDAGGQLGGYVVEYASTPDRFPSRRSTRYTGDTLIRFERSSHFSPNLAMSVEGWVYREDATRTEGVLTHGDIAEGFVFGFAGDKIRFGRSGGFAELSFDPVPANQWTHVAATYDGTTVRFYINGTAAGARTVQNRGAVGSYPLRVAGANGGGVLPFRGSLDELRLWSTVRSQTQLSGNQFTELREQSGLIGVWPEGGRKELVTELSQANQGPWAELQRTGILPQDLIVPKALGSPQFDGNVDTTTEYAGAEEVVIRYDDGPSYSDAHAYLVHTKEYLYIGIEGARLPTGGSPSPDNILRVFLDRDGASTSFNQELFQGQLYLENSLCAMDEVGQRSFENPVTGELIFYNVWEDANPTSVEYQCHQGTERIGELTTTRDIEFRFHRSLLGEFDLGALHRFAIQHADHGGPGGEIWAPHGGNDTAPATWATLRYYPRAGDVLPSISSRGTVINPASGTGLAGIEVTLSGSTAVYATTTTLADGTFQFSSIPAGEGDTLRVRLDVPEGAVAFPATFTSQSSTEDPFVVGAAELIFPGCSSSSCHLATIQFNLRMPLPAVEISAVFPTEIHPPVVVRDGTSPKSTATSAFRVDGTNLHGDLEFFLLRDYCPNDPTASAFCEEGVDYFRLNANLFELGGGFPAVHILEIPDPVSIGSPEVTFPHAYRLAAHDTWARPANDPASPTSWRYAPGTVAVTEPPYELIHGFPFQNISDGHDLDDYRAAFYDQICNPLTMVGAWAYAPIYLALTGDGECVGMVVTANQMARGKFNTGPGFPLNPTHGDVRFGNGFQFTGARQPILPASFDTSNPCSPVPLNIWAKIRANHGVQFSSEFIGAMLSQFDLGEHGLVINHADALDKIRSRPLHYQICIRDGDKGHCVQPLRVIDTIRDASGVRLPNRRDIEVWDPNWPEVTRTIEITIEQGQPGRYFYDGFTDPWEGNWLFVYEIDPLWDGERHIPSADTLGLALTQFGADGLGGLLQLVVSGSAEPMVTSAGGSVGWDGAGNFSESGTSTLALPQFNWLLNDNPPLGHHPGTIVHRLDAGDPSVTLHNRGPEYKVHASHQGTMFQLFVEGGVAGTDDTLLLPTANEKVQGIAFTTGSAGKNLAGRIALSRDGSTYPAAIGFDALPVPAGKGLILRALPGEIGVELLNDTGTPLTPTWRLAQPTAAADGAGPEEIEIPQTDVPVPVGAAARVISADGLTFHNLFVDIDLDRDGLPEFSYVYLGDTGQLQKMTPGAGPELEVTVANGIVAVAWDHIPGWELALSDNLLTWNLAQGVTVQNGRATWFDAGMPVERYFRFERYDP